MNKLEKYNRLKLVFRLAFSLTVILCSYTVITIFITAKYEYAWISIVIGVGLCLPLKLADIYLSYKVANEKENLLKNEL